MPGDIQGEFPIASAVSELVSGWAAKGYAAENEGSGVVRKFLVAVLSILAGEADGLQLVELELGEANGRRYALKQGRRYVVDSGEPAAASISPSRSPVRKLYQKSI